MKINFFKRLNTRIFLIPAFLLLVVFIAGSMAFYFFSYPYFLKDFHKLHLMNISSEKRLIIDTWFERYISDLENFSRLRMVIDAVPLLTEEPLVVRQKSNTKKQRKTMDSVSEAKMNILRIFDEKVSSGRYKMFALLSKNGKVVSSSWQDLVGEDWSGRDFLKNANADIRSTVVTGSGREAGIENGIGFLTPVFDGHGNIVAFIYATASMEELSDFLKVERGLYRSESIELIDRHGNVVVTREGVHKKKVRYNLPQENKENQVRYKDGLFFYVLNLEHAPFRVISTVVKSDVTQPFTIMIAVYFSFIGAIILMMFFQNKYLAKRFISQPVLKLSEAAKSGKADAGSESEYTGELLELKKSFDVLRGERNLKKTGFSEDAGMKELTRLRAQSFSKMAYEIRNPLNAIINEINVLSTKETILRDYDSKSFEAIRNNAKSLLQTMEDLIELSELEGGKIAVLPEEFNMCELVKEVEDIAKGMVGAKEVEVIADCQEAFMNRPVYIDRQRVRQLMVNLVSNAVKTTEAGTITILVSSTAKDGVEYIEASIADTGTGIAGVSETFYALSREKLAGMFDEFSYSPASMVLAISRSLTELLGGKIEIENIAGKGTVFTVIIPSRAAAA